MFFLSDAAPFKLIIQRGMSWNGCSGQCPSWEREGGGALRVDSSSDGILCELVLEMIIL